MGLDSAKEKNEIMSTDPETVHCSCSNPNGFEFVEYEDSNQVWRHVKCGGLVVRLLIRSGR